jgi:hypothetical protein
LRGKPRPNVDACVRLHCFVDVCGGKGRDGRCQWIRKRSLLFHTPLPIGLNINDFAAKHPLDKLLKLKKIFGHLRFMTKEINSSKFTIIINKTHIVFLVAEGINGRTPHI